MRLGYVLHQFPELSQTFVLRQIIGLLERGHSVEVIAARPGEGAQHHAALSQLTARFGMTTSYTGMPGGLVRRALRGARLLLPALLEHPAAVAVALDVTRFGWFAAGGSLLTMGMPLARQRRCYDAIIAHFGPQGAIAQGLREMRVLDGPLITFFHAYDLTSAPRLAGPSMYRRLFERGELLLAISQRGARQLQSLGAPAEKIRVHHMGVRVDQFRPSEQRRAARAEPLRVVSIGRLMEKKGFEHGLRAVAAARSQGATLEYAIYGSGTLAAKLERRIDSLGLRGVARLCGAASPEHLSEVLRRSDVLLVPSVTSPNGDEEGIPVVVMEALATELGVVATDCGGMAELVVHEHSGLLVPQRDPDALAAALCRLHFEPELATRLGREGRARVQADFNEQRQSEQLLALLAQLQPAASDGQRASAASSLHPELVR